MDESRTLSWLSRCSEERSQVEACGIPELKCACGWPAAPRTSSTIRNPARRWLQCGGEVNLWPREILSCISSISFPILFPSFSCKVYDAIYGYGRSPQEYVEDMMAYYHAGEYNSLRETRNQLRWQLVDAQGHNIELSSILEAKEEQLQLCRDELNQSKRELAEMKDKIESEKDMLQWVMHMLMLMCVLCVPVVVGKNYLR